MPSATRRFDGVLRQVPAPSIAELDLVWPQGDEVTGSFESVKQGKLLVAVQPR